jgi:hypothetical protein
MTNTLIDETGNRYGKLTVVSRAENKRTKARWLCQCDCGKEHTILGTDLRTGILGRVDAESKHGKASPLARLHSIPLTMVISVVQKDVDYHSIYRRIYSVLFLNKIVIIAEQNQQPQKDKRDITVNFRITD